MITGWGDLPDTSPTKNAKEIPIVTIRRCLGPILNPMLFAIAMFAWFQRRRIEKVKCF